MSDSQHSRRLSSAIAGYVVLCLAVAFGASPALGQTTDSLHLEQAIRDVVRNNDRAAAARFMEEAARANEVPSGAWDDPMLMLGIQNVPTNFDFHMDDMTMTMVGLSQRVPYSGYKGLAKKAAESRTQSSVAERKVMDLDLVTSAKLAFFDLYYRQMALRDLENQRELQQRIIESTTAKLRANQAGQQEVLGAQAELWRLESSILEAQQEVISSANRLYSLRGLGPPVSPPALAAPSPSTLPESSGVWIETARRVYPPLQKLQRQAESYVFLAQSSKRMRWPMLDLSASYGIRSGNRMTADGMLKKRDNMLSFGLSLSLPIFSGRQQGQMARSMEAMQRSTEAEAEQLWRDVQAELATLYQRARQLTQSLTMYRERIIPTTEDAFHSALAAYAGSTTDFATVLMYAQAVYRDRVSANELAGELARTVAEAERYITDPGTWESSVASQTRHVED